MGACCPCFQQRPGADPEPDQSKSNDCTILVVGDVLVGKTTMINCFQTEKA